MSKVELEVDRVSVVDRTVESKELKLPAVPLYSRGSRSAIPRADRVRELIESTPTLFV